MRQSRIKVWQIAVSKLSSSFKISCVSYIQMAVRWVSAQQDTITKCIKTSATSWFPVMCVPCPNPPLVIVGANECLPTSGTTPSLSLPSFLYSVTRKRHPSITSSGRRVWDESSLWSNVKNGWSTNSDRTKSLLPASDFTTSYVVNQSCLIKDAMHQPLSGRIH